MAFSSAFSVCTSMGCFFTASSPIVRRENNEQRITQSRRVRMAKNGPGATWVAILLDLLATRPRDGCWARGSFCAHRPLLITDRIRCRRTEALSRDIDEDI